MLQSHVLWGLTFNLPGIIFTASEANPWENLWYSTKLSKNEFVRVVKCILKGFRHSFWQWDWGKKKKSGGCAAAWSPQTSLFVFLRECSAPCQAAGEKEAWAESLLPHKGHSLSAAASGLTFNRRQTASCMCGQNNSISSVGVNRQLFVQQLSVCLSQT